MADYARAIHEAEKLENDMYDFLEKGNDMSEFDPSASEDDSEAEIEESDEVVEDPLAEDDLETLKKYFLISADSYADSKRVSQMEMWAELLRTLDGAMPDLANVIEYMMVIPSSTAQVERFFKILKSMKTNLRNRLSSKKLKQLFMIHHFLDLQNYDGDRVLAIFQEKLKELRLAKSEQDKQRRDAAKAADVDMQ